MEEVSLVSEGLKFMALGMGTVFLFLVVMITLMIVQAKIITRFFPEPHQEESAAAPVQQKQNINNKIAAISAAIMHHNQSK